MNALREKSPQSYILNREIIIFSHGGIGCQREKDYIYKQYQLVSFIYTVSQGASEQIKKIFRRDSTIINNAIDNTIFYQDIVKEEKQDFTLMMIGSENNEFKGISDIMQALSILEELGYRMKLVWVTPNKPIHSMRSVFVNPKQSQIGDLLRKSDVFICASHYESFSLPVLEAMASGCVVLTTKNKGVVEYAEDGKNCIMFHMNNPENMAEKIISVIKNDILRKK